MKFQGFAMSVQCVLMNLKDEGSVFMDEGFEGAETVM